MPLSLFKKIYSIFDSDHKNYIFFIFLIFFLQMFLELFSVSLFIPLISIILDTNIETNSFYLFFKNKLNIDIKFLLGDIKSFLLFFIGVFILKSCLTIFCNWKKIGFTYKIRKFLTNHLYKNYLQSPYEIFISKNSSEYLKNINYEVSTTSEGLLQLLELFSEIIIITGIIIFLLSYNFEVTLIVFLIALLAIFIINFLTKRKISSLGEKARLFEQLRTQNFLESFNLIKEIKIYGNEKFFFDKNLNFTSNFLNNDFFYRFIKSIPRVLIELTIILIFIVLVIINFDTVENFYLLEILGVFAAAAYRLLPSSVRIINSLQVSKFSSPAINNIISEIKSKNYTFNQSSNKKDINKFDQKIEFLNVTFKYKETNKNILNNFNLKISKNKIYGFKGKTGSGKTTIINLLAGLIFPQKGTISIDNLAYEDINMASLHKIISYVPQNIYLMDSSIKENILFGSNKYSSAELENAIKKSNLDEFINQLPDGIDTIIGEKSSKISGGQSQRIGIARALIKKPSILILDESTNSLDKNTEDLILQSISKLKKNLTIIMVSHSSSSLKICEEIIDLDDNK